MNLLVAGADKHEKTNPQDAFFRLLTSSLKGMNAKGNGDVALEMMPRWTGG